MSMLQKLINKELKMEKVVMFAKARTLPIGSIRKHGGSLYKKTAKGWMRVKKKGHVAKDKPVAEKKPQVNDIYTRILNRQKEMDKKYAPLKGMKVKTPDGQEWEFQQTNDLGIPYFSMVKKNIVQKKQFTIAHLYSKEWADKTLSELQKKSITVKKKKVQTIKEPWEMKQKEWIDGHIKSPGMHREHIRRALLQGKSVPSEVLKDYPGLKKPQIAKKKAIKKPTNTVKTTRQTQKVRAKSSVKPKTVKQPIKKKKSIAKKPIKKKVTLRTVTEQYQEKIKQLSIMNRPGRLIYKKMIQQAIKDKDKEQLKLIFKDIDNWLLRNKQFKKKKNIRTAR